MKEGYKNRKMSTEGESQPATQAFFFPKENPPVTIQADSLEEAQEKLEAIRNKKTK